MKILVILFTTAAIAIGGNACHAQQGSSRGKLHDVPVYPISAIAEFGTGGWSGLEPNEGAKVNAGVAHEYCKPLDFIRHSFHQTGTNLASAQTISGKTSVSRLRTLWNESGMLNLSVEAETRSCK